MVLLLLTAIGSLPATAFDTRSRPGLEADGPVAAGTAPNITYEKEQPDTFKLDFMSGISRSKLDSPMRATVQFDAPNVDGFSFDFRQNRDVPILNFGIDVANPDNFTFGPQDANGTLRGQFVGRYLNTRNKLKTTELNGSFELNDNLTLRGGYSNRKNTWSNVEIGSGGNGLALPAGVTVADISQQISGFG